MQQNDSKVTLLICPCYNSGMRAGRRLLLMAAGLMVLCSSSLAWINGQMPIDTSLGAIISATVSTLSNHAITLDIAVLDNISVAATLFTIGVIILIAAVLGSRFIGLFGIILSVATMVLWAISAHLQLHDLVTQFWSWGMGIKLALIGTLLSLLVTLLPRLRLPGRS